MASASYYKDLMNSYSKSRKSYEDRKSVYDAALEKIKKLNNNLSDVSENLKLSEEYFHSGGYVDGGVTLDRGALKSNYTKIDNYSSELKEIINNTEIKIKEYNDKITYYKNLYIDAKKNYERVKREEMK